MKRLLASLPFTFLVLGGLIVWELHRTWRGERGEVQPAWVGLLVAGAVICFALSLIGFRERRLRMRQTEIEEDRPGENERGRTDV